MIGLDHCAGAYGDLDTVIDRRRKSTRRKWLQKKRERENYQEKMHRENLDTKEARAELQKLLFDEAILQGKMMGLAKAYDEIMRFQWDTYY